MGSIVRLDRKDKILRIRLSFVTEFTNLIQQKVPLSKKKEFSFPPGSGVFETRTPYPTSKNHHPADQDPWDEKAQTKEFSRREFGK